MPITTTPSGGAQGEFSTYTPIYATTLSANASSITLSNIPSTFTDLVLVINGGTTTNNQFRMNVGSSSIDSGSNYGGTQIYAYSSTVGSGRETNASNPYVGVASSTNSTHTIQFQNYSNNNSFKTWISKGGDTALSQYDISAYTWRSTSIIGTIQINTNGGTIASGTSVTLYGIKAAAPAPKATGGDLVYTDNTYWYHVFNNSGIFDVKTAMNVDYLVVAGGGGGGCDYGAGGGGAGGLRSTVTATGGGGSLESQLSLLPVQYPVVVGAGGPGGRIISGTIGSYGTTGSNSTLASISSNGGGGGAFGNQANSGSGLSGGSGGGAYGFGTESGGARTVGQGFAGGSLVSSGGPWPAGAGGGGAGAVGGNASGGATSPVATGGAGGNGVAVAITGASVTYAGGGGGTSFYNSSGSYSGGAGGGGAGVRQGSGVAGTTNLGGGGGAGGSNSAGQTGGNGGSGVVIVRYAV
jgi:hypothetical protein